MWQHDLMTQAPSLTYQSLVAATTEPPAHSGADLILLNNKPMQEPISAQSALLRNLSLRATSLWLTLNIFFTMAWTLL